ncbi:MAG: hypothetical protein JSW14_06195 [Candidatus Bathyarchaeum sp.]|nr:MAG: hypothetical protein JSW14_06195 [Candidatus Bathyarchaeum sp.]
MEEKRKNENDDDSVPRMKKMMKEFFTDNMKKDFEDIKDDATKGLKRSFAVLFIVAFGWIIFVSLHCFLWSTSYTFYQNLVITFDSLIVAVLIGISLIYKVSGLGNISKKLSKLTKRFTKNDED